MSVLSALPDKKTFELVSKELGISEAFVEKDWYVTQVIGIISQINHQGFKMIFAGGTALSKAHRLIQRFSEDVDFRAIAPQKLQNRKALSDFKQAVLKGLQHAGFKISEAQVEARDENHFFAIGIDYETVFARADALRSHIQVEVTVKNPQLPSVDLPVASFVAELAKQLPEVEKISCINPVENAADKLSALAWRIPDRVRGGKNDDPSLVRHIHDLAILKDVVLENLAFGKLVLASMEEDDGRSKNNLSFAGLPLHEKFNQMLSILDLDAEYSKEYDRFVNGMSYAHEANTPNFEMAVAAVKQLVNKVISS